MVASAVSVGGGSGVAPLISVITSLSKMMMDHSKHEGKYKFIEALPTPEKKEIKSEMARYTSLRWRQSVIALNWRRPEML